jgi:uncharacterized protein (DUF1501 family)
MTLNRRKFLGAMGLFGMGATLPSPFLFSKEGPSKRLVLIQLVGGNDGLNTVIPYQDDLYYKLRPKISLKKESVLKINDDISLHPGLKGVDSLFKKGEVAIIEGVGLPSPNLSHFRAMDIMETGSSSHETLTKGWITRTFESDKKKMDLNGIVLGAQELGPLQGDGLKSLSIKNLNFFKRTSRKLKDLKLKELSLLAKENEALKYILEVEKGLKSSSQKINEAVMEKMETTDKKYSYLLKRQVQSALSLIKANPELPVVVLSFPGFDTHRSQLGSHHNLLRGLDMAIESLSSGLKKMGEWERSLILTYSEFGRRVQENESLGTDHGTANVFFALGGKVKGGVYGKRPSLKNLEDGNLVYTTDYRSVYQTVIESWWGNKSFQLGPSKIDYLHS